MNQRHVSVRGEVFYKLRARAAELGVPVSQLVDQLLESTLYPEGKPPKEQPAPSVDPPPAEG
jgi:hypothetical protein